MNKLVIGEQILAHKLICSECNYKGFSNEFGHLFDFKNKVFGFQCPKCKNQITNIKYINTIYNFKLEKVKKVKI